MIVSPTIRFDIYMAGDFHRAKQICREFCYSVGLCVHIEALDFIYTGGEEAGLKVGLINYPRFPSTLDDLRSKAISLAAALRSALCQHSYTIVGPGETVWSSKRDQTT